MDVHLLDSTREYPFFRGFVFLSIASALLEIGIVAWSIVHLLRQRRFRSQAMAGDWKPLASLKELSRAPEILAVVLPLAVALLHGFAVQGSRSLLAIASTLAGPEDRWRLVARAFSAETIATEAGLWSLAITGSLACLAAGLAISARRRGRGLLRAAVLAKDAGRSAAVWLQHPGPRPIVLTLSIAAFFGFGFGPVIQGGLGAAAARAEAFAPGVREGGVPGAQPFTAGLDQARALLDSRLGAARIGVAIAAGIAALLAWLFSPERARSRSLGPLAARESLKDTRQVLLLALAAFVTAAVTLAAARPLRHAPTARPLPRART